MRQHTFPAKERLRKKWEFERVFAGNEKYAGSQLTLYILRKQPDRKAGILVSKKTGIAVKRNRIKRLIREAYRLNKNLLPPDVHLLLTAKQDIGDLKYKLIEEDLLKLFKEAGFLKACHQDTKAQRKNI